VIAPASGSATVTSPKILMADLIADSERILMRHNSGNGAQRQHRRVSFEFVE